MAEQNSIETAYYFGTIKKLVAGFGMLFSDIHITRHYEDRTIKDVRIPLNYGARQAWYAKLKEKLRNSEAAAKFYRTLPRISYELGDFAFANDRQIPKMVKTVYRNESPLVTRIYRQYAPLAWDFTFTVSIAAKNIEDGLRIFEQIAPMFRPDHTITIEDIPNVMTNDVTINMVGVTKSDEYEGSITATDRVLTWDLQFIAHGYLLPPIRDTQLISEVQALMVVGQDGGEDVTFVSDGTTDTWN